MKKNSIFIYIVVFIIIIIGGIIIFSGRINIDINSRTYKNNNQKQTISAKDKIFPEFILKDINGQEFTKDSFAGKPVIVWFTTSWCVPCQIGAKRVTKLDDELGGNAFDVLVVFVDPRENNNDLKKWKEQFGNNDWIVAFDNTVDSLSQKINLKYLDTKYLLDKNGSVQNIDLRIADEKYLETIKGIINGN